ncbi:hypothetical protein E3P77_01360 [Wallemia ichthyophaga]|uniref:Ras-GAP domain-containing protein n=1 Tax=Wallemia ichthyophaga TaxID=245174 RepID=A0A4T0IBI5_WALIC|nr:hypothetical protein E3P98_01546 [Wallemia ichthyophaga]TIB13225.1 hypothetical protein E3P90_01684 [Wallemia ichthyophaga]TIB14989.1 hypothetical protein E3P93_01434 [Wallemia ichthyophaga]TIB23945.1 hypothetical protein E3P89_01284 [Wallemia ichthyophaga]TIB25320.1 hypothetical protein E3P88_01639 [Wallemia ichthyophaga]
MDRYMNFMSRLTGWLEDSLGHPIREMIDKKVECELDTDRKGGPADKDELLHWADVILNSIIESRVGCPIELRKIFHNIRKQCHARWNKAQLVNSFIFLRLFVPAIINPNLFGLTNVSPSPGVSRTLTLIAKIIQALANNKEEMGDKEHFMGVVSPFLQDHNRRFAFIDYVAYVGNEDSAASYKTSEEISINELATSVEKTSDRRFNDCSHDIYRQSLPRIDNSRELASFTNDLNKIYNKVQLNELQNRDHYFRRKSLNYATLELFEASMDIQEDARQMWESRQRHRRKANSAYESSKPNRSECLSDQQDLRSSRKVSVSSSSASLEPQMKQSPSQRRRGFTITGLSNGSNNWIHDSKRKNIGSDNKTSNSKSSATNKNNSTGNNNTSNSNTSNNKSNGAHAKNKVGNRNQNRDKKDYVNNDPSRYMDLGRGFNDYQFMQYDKEKREKKGKKEMEVEKKEMAKKEEKASPPNTPESMKNLKITLDKYRLTQEAVDDAPLPKYPLPVSDSVSSNVSSNVNSHSYDNNDRSKSRASVRNSATKGEEEHSKDDINIDNKKKTVFFKWTKGIID